MDAIDVLTNLDNLKAYFQPIFSADEHIVVGYEVTGKLQRGLGNLHTNKPKQVVPIWPIVKDLTIVSISASISALLFLLFQLVDSFTIFQTLVESGLEKQQAMEMKGIYDRGQPLVQGIVCKAFFCFEVVYQGR